tara:strand:- start:1039 stop:2157 length:1119 start_codon:yes stop_codon:yes gene_type:complete
MKVTSVVEKNQELSFVLSDVDMSIANGLRRTILSDIPIVVIKTFPAEKNDVNITINTTRLNNEILKQRLSCLPIHIKDLSTPIDQLVIELDVENTSTEYKYVTTEDIRIKNESTGQYLKQNDLREIFPSNQQTGYYIDIVRLRPKLTSESTGERLTLTAKLSIATADDNSMFNSVSTCSYGFTQDEDEIKKRKLIKEQELKDKDIPKSNKDMQLNDWIILDAQRIFKKNSFDFVLKSVGVFDNKDIIHIACDRLMLRFDNIIAAIVESDEEKRKQVLDVNEGNTTLKNGYDIRFYNEDYTLGGVVQYLLHSLFYESAEILSFCGFKKLHPHDSYILLRMAYKEPTTIEQLNAHLLDTMKHAKQIFADMKKLF